MSQLTLDPNIVPQSAVEPDVPLKKIIMFGGVAVVVAALVNGLILVLSSVVLRVPAFGPLNPILVGAFTIIGVVLATVVFAIITRMLEAPARSFRIVAAAVLVLSFIPNILALTGVFNPAALLGPGGNGNPGTNGGNFQRTPRAGQAQDGTPVADGQRAAGTPRVRPTAAAVADPNAAADAQGTDAGPGQNRRGGQGFGGFRVPQQLTLMMMHLAAFIASVLILPLAIPAPKRETTP